MIGRAGGELMAEPNGRPQVDDESRRYMRKYGYAAWQAWQAAGRPGPPPPEVDADEDQAGDEPVRCHACGALFTGYHCDECGTPATPTPGRLLHGLALSLEPDYPWCCLLYTSDAADDSVYV